MIVKGPLITILVPGKVEKENHIRKVQKKEEIKVKNIGKRLFFTFGTSVNKLTHPSIRKSELDFPKPHSDSRRRTHFQVPVINLR